MDNDLMDQVLAPDIKNLKNEVENAEEEKLIELSDAIVACGYMGPINVDKKKAIIDAITMHSLMRLIPILQQLQDGLRLYGIDAVLAQHPKLCQQLFVPGHIKEVDSDFLVRALYPDFSEEGSVKRQREMKVINFLQDFLQKLEDEEAENQEEDHEVDNQKSGALWESHVAAVPGTTGRGKHLSVRSFFQWVTVGITFPIRHLGTYHDFEDSLTTAIRFGYEFSRH
ncbi:uncharacterized protein LOC125905192 [Epinephelus fuscoguttatus]|uniref:uncharacterized protein LOC125905192 n=1 Tax=Epinephelus fuscoguttatus TaxID=293821 RepID=UPI0020D1E15F|nr:uncharacterized protein LOC125905192 [Epinephelus fuscoguttatus]